MVDGSECWLVALGRMLLLCGVEETERLYWFVESVEMVVLPLVGCSDVRCFSFRFKISLEVLFLDIFVICELMNTNYKFES